MNEGEINEEEGEGGLRGKSKEKMKEWETKEVKKEGM